MKTFAKFLASFDFRLFQQYLPTADIADVSQFTHRHPLKLTSARERCAEVIRIAISTSIYDSPSTAHLNGLQAPAMGGVHTLLHHVAIAVVIVGIVVRIVVIVVVRVVAAEADSKAAPEVAVVPEAAIMVEAATRFSVAEGH
jgi:hypothetical protein